MTASADVPPAADRAGRMLEAGLAASKDGRPALAVRRFRAALRALDTAALQPRHPALRGRILVSLAWAESERGHVERGFHLLDQAEALVAPTRLPVLYAQRAVLLNRNGRGDLAQDAFARAMAGLSEPEQAADLALALNNRSIMHMGMGRVGAARADLRRCVQVSAGAAAPFAAALSGYNLGYLDFVSGDLPEALRRYAMARENYREQLPGRLSVVAIGQGRALAAAGLFREADAEFGAAIAQARDQQQDHIHADALHFRAEAALLAGRPSDAARWARLAYAEFRARHNQRRAVLARLLELRADVAAALPENRPADRAARESSRDDRAAHVPGPAGRAAADRDLFAALAGRAKRTATLLRRLGLAEDVRIALLVAARCTLRATPGAAAARLVQRAGAPGRMDRLDTRLLWRLTRAEIAAADNHPAERSRHLLAGMEALHHYRAQLGCLDLQTGASAHGQDLVRAGLTAALGTGSIPAVFRWSERARAQALLLPPVRPPDDPRAAEALEELRQTRFAWREAELAGRPTARLRAQAERLQHTIREHSWSTSGGRSAAGRATTTLAAVRAELGDAALVSYLRDGGALRALVITRDCATIVALGAFRDAEEALLRLRADLDTGAGRSMPARMTAAVTAATRRDAGALAGCVLDEVVPLIGDRELVVVPAGLLMTTPWGLLPGCQGRPVTVAPSATAWLAARHRRAAPGEVVLVSGPGTLRADHEVRAIAGLRPAATVLTLSNATPNTVLSAIDGAGIAHLAAHGRHQTENALFSSLELAGGPLLGYDFQRLRRPPSLVVLSCCDLGLTDVRPGDESFGLASALLAAGTATVVASVARVADDAATDTMIAFHRELGDGRTPSEALAAAAGPARSAGFVCLGAG